MREKWLIDGEILIVHNNDWLIKTKLFQGSIIIIELYTSPFIIQNSFGKKGNWTVLVRFEYLLISVVYLYLAGIKMMIFISARQENYYCQIFKCRCN